MDKAQLESLLLELKSDYVRIQGDMDKLEAVDGRVSSAEEQLIRLEKKSPTYVNNWKKLNKRFTSYCS